MNIKSTHLLHSLLRNADHIGWGTCYNGLSQRKVDPAETSACRQGIILPPAVYQ